MTADEALDQLRLREPIFHRPELGQDVVAMVTDDFWEIGASGRIYRRGEVLDTLRRRREAGQAQDAYETSAFECRKLSADTFLLTYTLLENGARKTRRSTIWRHTPEGWRIAFHQGTIVQE